MQICFRIFLGNFHELYWDFVKKSIILSPHNCAIFKIISSTNLYLVKFLKYYFAATLVHDTKRSRGIIRHWLTDCPELLQFPKITGWLTRILHSNLFSLFFLAFILRFSRIRVYSTVASPLLLGVQFCIN